MKNPSEDPLIPSSKKIFQEFRRGVYYEELYKTYDITENGLIKILQRNIKGNYDYHQILSGGLRAQKQFIKHLNSRWNPLEHEIQRENISPYLSSKEREFGDDSIFSLKEVTFPLAIGIIMSPRLIITVFVLLFK